MMIKRQFVADARSESQLPDEDEDPLPHERTSNPENFFDIASYLSGIPQQAIKNSIKPSERSLSYMKAHFPDATLADWADWRWQIGHSVTQADQLKGLIRLSQKEKDALDSVLFPFRCASRPITPASSIPTIPVSRSGAP